MSFEPKSYTDKATHEIQNTQWHTNRYTYNCHTKSGLSLTHRKECRHLIIVTSVTFPLSLFDVVPFADLSTFVLCVMEKEEDFDIFRKEVVNLVDG